MGLFIIAVIVLLICVCVSRIGSLDLREVAVAVEIVFSIAGGSDFITIRYYKEYSNYWQARSAQRNIGGY